MLNWKIKYVPPAVLAATYCEQNSDSSEDSYLFGYIDYVKTEILIDETLSEDMKKRTLMHELTHAFLFDNGWADIKEFTEEDVCNIVASCCEKVFKAAFGEEDEIRADIPIKITVTDREREAMEFFESIASGMYE